MEHLNCIISIISSWVVFTIMIMLLSRQLKRLNEEIREEKYKANQVYFELQRYKDIIKTIPQRDKRTGRFTKSKNKEFETLSNKF